MEKTTDSYNHIKAIGFKELFSMGDPKIGVTLKLVFFLVYVNNVLVGSTSVAKLSTDNTSLFSVVHDPKIAALSLNEDKLKINQWAYQ